MLKTTILRILWVAIAGWFAVPMVALTLIAGVCLPVGWITRNQERVDELIDSIKEAWESFTDEFMETWNEC